MAEDTNFVIHYTAEFESLKGQLANFERLNAQIAASLGNDFDKALTIIDQKLENISRKPIKITTDDGKTRDAVATLQTFSTTVTTTTGKTLKLTEVFKNVEGEVTQVSSTIRDLTKALAATIPPSFVGRLDDVTKALQNQERIAKRVQETFGQGITTASPTTVTNIKPVTSVINGKTITEEVKTFQTQIKLADGSMKTLVDTVKSVDGNVTNMASTFKDSSTKTISFAENMKRLAERAALTIPIWLALRSAITGVFQGIKDGLSNVIAFDTALQKLRINLSGSPAEIEAAFQQASTVITAFSRQTGVSTEEITEAVRKFSTIGFDFNDALAGGIAATKLSIALFGDASETANTFARAIKILTDNSKDAASAADQMAEAFALTAKLEKTNQFDISEVNESLIKFAPTAKSAGLSLRETLVLLATLGTAGRTGANAGTLLSSSVNELRNNLDKLAGSLGVSVNPNLDTTFTVITKVLDKAQELGKIDNLGARQAKALADVFGGERGTKTIGSLVALANVFKENAKIIPSVTEFEAQFQAVNDTLGNNVRKLSNDLKENGKAFINAVTGGENLNDTVKKLDASVKGLLPTLTGLGTVIGAIFANLGLIAGTVFVVRFTSVVTLEALLARILLGRAALAGTGARLSLIFAGGFLAGIRNIGLLLSTGLITAVRGASLATVFAGIFKAIPVIAIWTTIGKVAIEAFTNAFVSGQVQADKAAQTVFDKINVALKGKLSKFELTELIVGIQEGNIKLDANVNKQRLLAGLRKQLENTIISDVKIKVQRVNISFLTTKETQDISQSIIQDQLTSLKAQGATTSELLKQESLLNKQFNIFEDENAILQRQLATQRALSEEQRLQNRLGSDSIKLFEIAQTEGVDIAKQIGEVLAGNNSFDIFVRQGGKALDVFKDKFKDIFEQQQALAFFQGNTVPGIANLRGGAGIPIQEQVVQNALPQAFNVQAAIAAQRATGQIPEIRASIQNTINATIGIEVKGLSFREAVKAMKEELARDLLNPESETSKSLDQHIDQH